MAGLLGVLALAEVVVAAASVVAAVDVDGAADEAEALCASNPPKPVPLEPVKPGLNFENHG